MFINIHKGASLFVSLLDGRGSRFRQIMFVMSPYWIPWVVKLSFYPGFLFLILWRDKGDNCLIIEKMSSIHFILWHGETLFFCCASKSFPR